MVKMKKAVFKKPQEQEEDEEDEEDMEEVEDEEETEEEAQPKVKKPLKPKKEYSLVNVPTQHALAIQDSKGELLSTEEAIVEILNKLRKIEKAIVG